MESPHSSQIAPYSRRGPRPKGINVDSANVEQEQLVFGVACRVPILHVPELAEVALKRNQESVSIPGLHKPDVAVICDQLLPIFIIEPFDGEGDGPGVAVATGTPTTPTGRVRRPTRGKVGAEDSFGKVDGPRAAFLPAITCQIGHKCQLSTGKQACGARKGETQR